MSKTEGIQISGCKVLEVSRGGVFTCLLPNTNHPIKAYPSGKLRKNNIYIVPGDFVTLELTAYDLRQARIVYREK
jgi:translation initiation factor IF-1